MACHARPLPGQRSSQDCTEQGSQQGTQTRLTAEPGQGLCGHPKMGWSATRGGTCHLADYPGFDLGIDILNKVSRGLILMVYKDARY